jgi:hypothetical protein
VPGLGQLMSPRMRFLLSTRQWVSPDGCLSLVIVEAELRT